MPRIEQKQRQFQPVTITLETQSEFGALVALIKLASASDRIPPASPMELLVTQLRTELEAGIRVTQ